MINDRRDSESAPCFVNPGYWDYRSQWSVAQTLFPHQPLQPFHGLPTILIIDRAGSYHNFFSNNGLTTCLN